jgi:RNA polymerase sigma factor (TIGR02999 family)
MPAPDLTALLARARGGEEAARAELFTRLYGELKRLARAQLGRGRRDVLLDTTMVVHEAYLRLAPDDLGVESRNDLLNLAAHVMRHVVIDLARRRSAHKRGEALRITWPEGFDPGAEAAVGPLDLLALDAALGELERESPRLARLVDLRFFGGLALDEIAAVLDVSERTLKRDWRRARAFLWARLHGSGAAAAAPESDGGD